MGKEKKSEQVKSEQAVLWLITKHGVTSSSFIDQLRPLILRIFTEFGDPTTRDRLLCFAEKIVATQAGNEVALMTIRDSLEWLERAVGKNEVLN